MAVVFLLGPGMWDSARRQASDPAPLQVRRDLAKIFTHDHRVILMEDDPDREGEDLIQKFDRLLRHKVSDVVLYWPPAAKMQTTYDELILLCDLRSGIPRRICASRPFFSPPGCKGQRPPRRRRSVKTNALGVRPPVDRHGVTSLPRAD